MKIKRKPSVVEQFMLPNPLWQEGYRSFHHLMGKPLGWVYIIQEDGRRELIRLDRKVNCSFYADSAANCQSCEAFLKKYGDLLTKDDNACEKMPYPHKCIFGKNGAVFALRHLGRIRGVMILCSFSCDEKQIESLSEPFDYFISTHIELAYKTFELNNFYETVHPRALALSTMHSVHRVISSSLRLHELLPRIGRLSAQVLKARGCSIMLCDSIRQYLQPQFSFGESSKYIHHNRLRIGRGLEGRIAKTGEFHLTRRAIAVPFIEDDVVGVITLWDKIDKQPFTRTDLEILKSLSEQAVVAIKNAQLYEETEQLTLGSIRTINELLELNITGDRSQLPIFSELIIEVGKVVGISSREAADLQRAILLLNAGALTFPDKILMKKGKLTKKEYELVKRMPMRGANLLRQISSLKPIIPIILHHRERYDGKGYPQGLVGEEIPVGARIVSVVDSFIAMISVRAYREPMIVEDAVDEILKYRGTQFDPQVVDCFMKVVQRKEFIEKVKKIQVLESRGLLKKRHGRRNGSFKPSD